MTDEKNEIAELRAELRAELAKVKAAQAALAPTPATDADIGRWRDEMHALSEARMARASNFSVEDLREMERACPTAGVKDIAAHGTIPTTICSRPCASCWPMRLTWA